MKQLQAFAAIMVCLVMPALAIVPDQDEWTVVTMAPDGAWGSATEPSAGQPLAKAIDNCKAMSGTKIGCGAQFEPSWQPHPFWWHAVLALG